MVYKYYSITGTVNFEQSTFLFGETKCPGQAVATYSKLPDQGPQTQGPRESVPQNTVLWVVSDVFNLMKGGYFV